MFFILIGGLEMAKDNTSIPLMSVSLGARMIPLPKSSSIFDSSVMGCLKPPCGVINAIYFSPKVLKSIIMSSELGSYSKAIAVPQSPNNGTRLLSFFYLIRRAVSPTKSKARLTVPALNILPAMLMAYTLPQQPIGTSNTKVLIGNPNLC